MPALIQRILIAHTVLLLACTASPEKMEVTQNEFTPGDDFVRRELFNCLVFIPNDFSDLTFEDHEDCYRFGALSKDEFIEIRRFSRNDNRTLLEFAQSRIDHFQTGLELLKSSSVNSPVTKDESIYYACDIIKPGSAHEWSYWMLYKEINSDFFELKTWTRRDRKIYFEQKANDILFSCNVNDSVK